MVGREYSSRLNVTDIGWHVSDMPSARALSVGFVLMPDFTMLALAAFLDTLRLAADESDRSRPIACGWTVMSTDGRAVRASSGVMMTPDGGPGDPAAFDYLVVVGGTLHGGQGSHVALHDYLNRAAALDIPLVGVCTGSFVLARAGLMRDRTACVSWFHKAEFEVEFPDHAVVADRLFVIDRDRITCAGGTGVIHLASHLVERHLGRGRADKGLRIMLEERARAATAPQPLPPGLDAAGIADPRVRRAILMLERRLENPRPLGEIAGALGVSTRQLSRLFGAATGRSPAAFREELRLARAHALVADGALPLTEVGLRCGFADASHFSRAYRRRFGETPTARRAAARAI